MSKLFVLGLATLLLGSPAISATYNASGSATGLLNGAGYSGNIPGSVSGGGNPLGFGGTFSATATNANGGYASAYAAEGISDVNLFNSVLGNYGRDDVQGQSVASVKYTMRIVGPATNTLIPVHVTMFAYAGSLAIPGPVGFYYAPITAGDGAFVTLAYSGGFLPTLPQVVAGTSYNYQYYTGGSVFAPVVSAQSDSFNGVVMMLANQDIDVDVDANATVNYLSTGSAIYTETAVGSAYADPTFVIEDPAYADYTITGVPAGPTAAAAPEASTWAMMLAGFAGLGVFAYRRGRLV